jgi:hypothetical protein
VVLSFTLGLDPKFVCHLPIALRLGLDSLDASIKFGCLVLFYCSENGFRRFLRISGAPQKKQETEKQTQCVNHDEPVFRDGREPDFC